MVEMGGRDRLLSAEGGRGPELDPGRVLEAEESGILGRLKLNEVEGGTRKDWPECCCWSCC